MISTTIHPLDSRTLKIKLRRGDISVKAVDDHLRSLKDLASNADYIQVTVSEEEGAASHNGRAAAFELIEVSE